MYLKKNSDSFVASGSVKEHLDINQPQSDYAINQAWLKEQSLQLK